MTNQDERQQLEQEQEEKRKLRQQEQQQLEQQQGLKQKLRQQERGRKKE